MNIILSDSQFNIENLYFMEPVVNTIMDNSMFIKILYSNKFVTLNGLYLTMAINITNNELYFKKIKYTYDVTTIHNNTILNKIYNIESSILDKYISSKPKSKKHIIYDTLKTGIIKIFPNQPNIHNHSTNLPNTITTPNQSINQKLLDGFILKISGIWENETEYGVTYKLSTS
jgi:hypothetical protein